MIPKSFIDDLLQRTDIIDVITPHTSLKKAGNSYVACCPFHQEKTPSFNVNPSKQLYYCFGCGVGGNAISFLMDYERLTYVEAIEALAGQLGLPVPREQGSAKIKAVPPDHYQLLQQVAEYYQRQLHTHPARQAALDYLQQRGISEETAKTFQLGFAPPGWDHLLSSFTQQQPALLATGMQIQKSQGRCYDRFRHRIMFPIQDNRGRIIGFGGRVIRADDKPKYLNSPETAIFHKGRELYGLYHSLQNQRQNDHIMVVEGYMDVVSLAQHGIHYSVATLGTATSTDHIKCLSRYYCHISFCFDGDKAGQAAAWRALETSLPLINDGLNIRFMFLPQGEDPDSFIQKQGKKAFEQQLMQAMDLGDFLFQHLQQQYALNHMAQKAKFIDVSLALLATIPSQTYQHLLLQQLASLSQTNITKLQEWLIKQGKHEQPQQVFIAQSTQQQPVSPMRLAVALLLQNPTLIEHTATTDLKKLSLPGSDILIRLITLLNHNPAHTTASLLEQWRGSEQFSIMQKLAHWAHHVPEPALASEFQSVLAYLAKQQTSHTIDDYLTKMKKQGLTPDERKSLQQLIASSKKRQ